MKLKFNPVNRMMHRNCSGVIYLLGVEDSVNGYILDDTWHNVGLGTHFEIHRFLRIDMTRIYENTNNTSER